MNKLFRLTLGIIFLLFGIIMFFSKFPSNLFSAWAFGISGCFFVSTLNLKKEVQHE